MSVTIRWRLRRLFQNQTVLFILELALLLLPIIGTLLSLTLLQTFSVYFVAPIVVALASVWSWFEYSRSYQYPLAETIAQLEDLVEDFGRINFQASATGDDTRPVKLLSLASAGNGPEAPTQPIADKVAGVRESYNTFQLWHLTLRDMVRVLARKGSLLAHDLVDAANYFIEFYNLFIENIVDTTLTLVPREDLEQQQDTKQAFNLYRENMAHLRGRTNDFLKHLADQGLLITSIEVKPVRPGPD